MLEPPGVHQTLGSFSATRPFCILWTTVRGGQIPGIQAPVRAVTICTIHEDNERLVAVGFSYCSTSDKFDWREGEDRSFKQVVSGPHGDPAVLRRIGKVFTKAERHALREAVWKMLNPEGWRKPSPDDAEEGHPLLRIDDQDAPRGTSFGLTSEQQEKANVREEDQGF